MNTLLNSDFISRLGWTLLHSLWQILTLGLALVIGRWIFRSPAVRHWLAMLTLLGSVAWPVVTFVRSGTEAERFAASSIESTQVVAESNRLSLPAKMESAPTEVRSAPNDRIITEAILFRDRHPDLMPWAGLAWLVGVLLLTLRQVGALYALHRLRTRGVDEVPAAIRLLFEQTKVRIGLRRVVRIVASARVVAPVVIGSLRPVVLMPISLLSGLPVDQMEALLAHELAHLRRWDDVWNLLQCIIETLLFYHPVVWWMSLRAREDRELCCDDLATARGIDRTSLAQALGRLALWQCEATQPALAATGHMPVLSRIERLLKPAQAGVSMNGWSVVTLLVACFCVGVMTQANAQSPVRGRIVDRSGVVLADCRDDGSRFYPLKGLAAHVIGYTGLNPSKDKTPIGRAGLEKSLNDVLTEKRDVSLTLDAKVQQFVEETLRQYARNGGAAVVIDVANGDIIAMGSWPTYDLNDFVPRGTLARFQELLNDAHKPLFGRAFQGEYFPGSTFKLTVALAGLKSGTIDETTIFDSPASYEIDGRQFHNWNKDGEGDMGLITAIKRSSNTWFYQSALKTGAQPISDMAKELGFGALAGLPVTAAKGTVPTDASSLEKTGRKMSARTLANVAIGQIVTASPLQVALATAAIANGGKVLRPRLIKSDAAPEYVNDLIANGLRAEHLDLVRKAMISVVNGEGGTGHNAMVSGITVAGKTGISQVHLDADDSKSTLLAWFTGFAPAEKPRFAIAVVYEGAPGEHVSGGALAAPIAREIFSKMMEKSLLTVSAVSPPAVKYVKPAPLMLTEQWIKSARCSVFSDMVVLCDGTVDDFDVSSSRFEGNVLVIEDGGKTISGGEHASFRHLVNGPLMDNDAITPLKLPVELQPLIDQFASRKPIGAALLTDEWLRSAKVKAINKSFVFFKGNELSKSAIQGDVVVVVETDGHQHVWGGENLKVMLNDDSGLVEPVEAPDAGQHSRLFNTISSELRQLISERVKQAPKETASTGKLELSKKPQQTKTAPKDEPAEYYYQAYLLNRAAEQAAASGEKDIGIAKFREALKALDTISMDYPEWQTDMMKFRREKIQKALTDL